MTGATGTGRRGLRAWGTRDLLVVAAVGVALGLALVPVIYVETLLAAALGPLGIALVAGLFSTPGLLSLHVVRRPGAALLNGLFVGLVQVPVHPGRVDHTAAQRPHRAGL